MRRLILCIVLALSVAPAFADPPPPRPPVEEGGRSGFWTSRAPAKGGAYRYRLLGIGVALALGTGFVMLRLIKKANQERSQRLR